MEDKGLGLFSLGKIISIKIFYSLNIVFISIIKNVKLYLESRDNMTKNYKKLAIKVVMLIMMVILDVMILKIKA